jgi:hypothetical protein
LFSAIEEDFSWDATENEENSKSPKQIRRNNISTAKERENVDSSCFSA